MNRCYCKINAFEESETILIEAVQGRKNINGDKHLYTIRTIVELGSLFYDANKVR